MYSGVLNGEFKTKMNGLLDTIDTFIGPTVTSYVKRSADPVTWLPVLERYRVLIIRADGQQRILAAMLYADLTCTFLTKKIYGVDVSYFELPVGGAQDTDKRYTNMRVAHLLAAKLYTEAVIVSAVETLRLGEDVTRPHIINAVDALYSQLSSMDFQHTTENTVFDVVAAWFCKHILAASHDHKTYVPINLSPGMIFTRDGPVYWLWLHITAGAVTGHVQDFLCVVYALDLTIYCPECHYHFLQHRRAFFHRNENNIPYTTYKPTELLYHLHTLVNQTTGAINPPIDILNDYHTFIT